MRYLILLLLGLNIASSLEAAEFWAYCDGSNRAYKTVQRFVQDCPKPKPGRPGEPQVRPDHPDPELCTSRPVTVVVNHPELDYVCALKLASETGDELEVMANTNRCVNSQPKQCEIGGGGVAGPGTHNVPHLAWYLQRGAHFPELRCQCGCFVGDTLISIAEGAERIDSLADRSQRIPVGVMQYPLEGVESLSRPLAGHDFTVGPEEKPIVKVTTAQGRSLAMTDLHPVLTERKGMWTMVQAVDLKNGDQLLAENGASDRVLSMESFRLDPLQNKVYNVDTRASTPEDHVIEANGIRVGDLQWQKKLSEDTARIQNLLQAAQ